jgi:quercetin dioxygenase-like cupin family protein
MKMKLIKVYAWMIIFLMMPVSPAVLAAEYESGVRGKVILQTDKMSNGEPIDYLDAEHPQVTVMVVDIPPGAQTGWHSHPMPVYAYVLAGQITVHVEGGKAFEFKEGEALVEVVKLQHNGINQGKVPVKLVVFYLGAKDVPNVIKSDVPKVK